MSSLMSEAQSIVDAKVSLLQAEVKEKISRLQGEVNEKIAHLLAEFQGQVSDLEATFGEERSRLNAPRNALSPVYRLPPEVLSRILFESLATSQESTHMSLVNSYSRIRELSKYYSTDRHAFDVWSGAHDALRLCHICQYWRTVALGFPKLWNHIQVKPSTRPEMLEFIRANAKKTPLDLDLQGLTTTRFKARDVLSKLLDASAGQLRSLALCCEETAFPRSEPNIFDRLTIPAAELESIELVVTGLTIKEDVNLFPSGTPKLCSLEIRGMVLPWSSQILWSPLLTELALHDTPHLNPATMRDLLSVLRHATQLESLHIDLPHQKTLTWDDVGGRPAAPVELPNIDNLQIVSRHFAPLSVLMEAIHLEHAAHVALKVFCTESKYHLQAICDFALSGAEPEQVEIGYEPLGSMRGFFVSCELRRTIGYDKDNSLRCWVDDLPWAVFNTGNGFPFPNIPSASEPRIPMSLSNLRILIIHGIQGAHIPQAFWEEISELATLTVIQMKSARLDSVAKFLKAMSMCQRKSDRHQSSTPSALQQSKKTAADPVTHPFPALSTLIFDSLEEAAEDCIWDLREAGYQIPAAWKHLPSIAVYLRFIASKLRCWRDYGHRYMFCLCFRAEGGTLDKDEADPDKKSQVLFEAVDDATMKMLKAVSVRVVFGTSLVWDLYADREERLVKSSSTGDTTTSMADGVDKE